MPRLYQPRIFALLGICAYLVGFVLPLPWHLPVIILALMSALAVLSGSRHRAQVWSPLTIAVAVFLASVGLSTLVSEDIGRSVRLSTAFLPGVLLFVVVADHFEGLWEVRLLYGTCSVVALALAGVVLWVAWHEYGDIGSHEVVTNLGIPVLVVPNDMTVLAIIAPMSLALFYHDPRSSISILAVFSVLLSIGAVCVFRSRTAGLTMVIALTCAAILMQPKRRLVHGVLYGLAFLLLALLIDGVLGFPLAAKVMRKGTILGRMDYWSTAWAMFQEAPLVGQGPHTFGLFHKTPWLHNLYLEVLAEQGLVGLLALGLLLACGFSAAWKVQRTMTGEARLLGAGALAGLIGFCCAGVVELSLLREWVVAMLFMLLGIIGHLASTQDKRERAGSC